MKYGHVYIVYEHLGMVITIRKHSKTLHVVVNTMTKGVGKITRRNFKEIMTVNDQSKLFDIISIWMDYTLGTRKWSWEQSL